MLSLVGISKSYGSQAVLRAVDWSVAAGERVGLAGANGAGKSTLLRIVAGFVEPDRGEVCFKKGATVGYLPQEVIGSRGEVVLVAHDRYFLDVTVTRISEIENGRLTDYACNFSKYEDQKAERLAQAQHAYEVQQEEIERMEGFIRKFRYQASKAKLVQSRVK